MRADRFRRRTFVVPGILVFACLLTLSSADGARAGGWQPGFHVSGMSGSVCCLLNFYGDLVAAGKFISAADVPARNIARFHQTNWEPLGPGLPDRVSALADHGGNIVAAHGVVVGSSVPLSTISLWDGAIWTDLGTANGAVRALVSWRGDLFAGGDFTSIAGIAASHLARWDGSDWQPLGGGVNGIVRALAVYGDALVAGGDFTQADTPAWHVASWDGAAWLSLGSGLSSPVLDLVTFKDDLYAAGLFRLTGGPTAARWNGSVWAGTAQDGVTSSWALATDGAHLFVAVDEWYTSGYQAWDGQTLQVVWCGLHATDICAWSDGVVMGGEFDAPQAPSHAIALWAGNSCMPIGPAGLGVGGPITTMANRGGGAIVGGQFQLAGTTPANGAAAFLRNRWGELLPVGGPNVDVSAIGIKGTSPEICGNLNEPVECRNWCNLSMHTGCNAGVRCMFSYNGTLYFGRFSGSAPLVSTNSIYDDGIGTGWSYGEVDALSTYQGRLVAGGSFHSVDGHVVKSVAVWDGQTWQPVGDGPGGAVRSLVQFGDLLIAGGGFGNAGEWTAGLKAWDGAVWRDLDPLHHRASGSAVVNALAVFDGQLVAGGSFDGIGGVSASNIARWDGTTWRPLQTGVEGTVNALLAIQTQLFIGGGFLEAGGLPSVNFAIWDGSLVPVRISGLRAWRDPGRVVVAWSMNDPEGDIRFHLWRQLSVGDRFRLTAMPLNADRAGELSFADLSPPSYGADYWLEELAAESVASTWHGPVHVAAAPVPTALLLSQNRPNPFNPRTEFTLALPRAGHARLTIHDVRGREVARPLDAELPAGERTITWDGRDAAGRSLPSGLYLARLDAGSATRTIKVTLSR